MAARAGAVLGRHFVAVGGGCIMVTCPSCNGQKQVLAFVHYAPELAHKNGLQTIDCLTCKGTGTITEEHWEAKIAAKKLQDMRVHESDYSLREFARLLDLSPVEYSSVERGDPEAWKQHGQRALDFLQYKKEE